MGNNNSNKIQIAGGTSIVRITSKISFVDGVGDIISNEKSNSRQYKDSVIHKKD